MPNKGFTLIELLVYIAIFALVIGAAGSFLLTGIRVQTNARTVERVTRNAERAMALMKQEIREASGVYVPTSVFDAHPGQLSLKTYKYAAEAGQFSYIDFFLCGQRLCLKKEGQLPSALTSEQVKIDDLRFTLVGAELESPSIRIAMEASASTSASRPEYQNTILLQSSAVLRAHE